MADIFLAYDFAHLLLPEAIAGRSTPSSTRVLPPPPPPDRDDRTWASYGSVTMLHGIRPQFADLFYQLPSLGSVVNEKWVVERYESRATPFRHTYTTVVHYLNREHPDYAPPAFPSVRTTRRTYELAPRWPIYAVLAWLLVIALIVAALIAYA